MTDSVGTIQRVCGWVAEFKEKGDVTLIGKIEPALWGVLERPANLKDFDWAVMIGFSFLQDVKAKGLIDDVAWKETGMKVVAAAKKRAPFEAEQQQDYLDFLAQKEREFSIR